jgi:hypothetical protein
VTITCVSAARRVAIGVVLACLLAVPGVERRTAAQSTPPNDFPCDIRTTERVVAIGDIHGAFDNFVGILRAAQLIDARNRWTGGRTVLVQTGDLLDRGADSRKAVDLLRRLERDAPRNGGRVVSLLGNHELMRIVADWRYVSTGEIEAFRTRDSEPFREQIFTTLNEQAAQRAKAEGRVHDAAAYREQFLREVPLGYIEMRQAFGPEGEYGKWVRERATVARVNGVVFLHGGISPTTAALGCVGINTAVRRDMASLPLPPEQLAALMSVSETGPLWYRGLANEPEEALAPVLPAILDQMQARAIVIGHTPVLPGRIATRFGGRVIEIDSGMLDGTFFPGGVPSALELRGDTATAIYLDRREPLPPLPALAPQTTAAAPASR